MQRAAMRGRSSTPAATAWRTWTTSSRSEAPARGVSEELAREYLTQHIVFELGERDYARPGSVSETRVALRAAYRRVSA